MKIFEIFPSIQGESSLVGVPMVFIRLTGCNLRCTYCDTKYAYNNGTELSKDEILQIIKDFPFKFVCKNKFNLIKLFKISKII
jgi:7-carboxy-7-deazaguanine synthase